MDLSLDLSLIEGYKSKTQQARILTESWVAKNIYCPNCGSNPLNEFENNRPVADFFCKKCTEEYELKSKNGKFSTVIPDGAYSTMIERIHSEKNPNFFFLNYNKGNKVEHFAVIPKHFFTPDIIIKRKPLSQTAKRAGWVGCNIVWSDIPNAGKIALVREGHIVDARMIHKQVVTAERLNKTNMSLRGWLMDVLRCVDKLNQDEFTLADMYGFTAVLQEKYAANHNIQAKIRQQLQFLRDQGYIQFVGNGRYRKIPM